MAQGLENKRVVITGASSGIGAAAAPLFASEGADVALIARSQTGLDTVARRVRANHREAHTVTADLADRADAERAVTEAASRLGGIDVLVSNAAAAAFGPFTQMSPEDFDRTVAVTFNGAVYAIRAAMPHLERSEGTIVANVSIVSRTPTPMQAPYTAAKHALKGFLGALRMELRHQGSPVTVSMVHPAPIDTPFWTHITSALDVHAKPPRPAYSAESAAKALVECAKHPRSELTVGGSGYVMNALWSLARPLAELGQRTYGIAAQMTDEPARAPGALWEPSGDGSTGGGFNGRRSLLTELRLRIPGL